MMLTDTRAWPVGQAPQDVLLQREVEAAIRSGAPLPKWGWPMPKPYNGASGAERIRGWQVVRIAARLGLIEQPRACSVCGRRSSIHRHSELYGRPLLAKPICKSCHFHVHRRFRSPDEWQAFLSRHSQGWVSRLPLRELDRDKALALQKMQDPFGLRED